MNELYLHCMKAITFFKKKTSRSGLKEGTQSTGLDTTHDDHIHYPCPMETCARYGAIWWKPISITRIDHLWLQLLIGLPIILVASPVVRPHNYMVTWVQTMIARHAILQFHRIRDLQSSSSLCVKRMALDPNDTTIVTHQCHEYSILAEFDKIKESGIMVVMLIDHSHDMSVIADIQPNVRNKRPVHEI